ncbi:YugN family protein [Virgibacillus sp. W0430]|uniref:YugN family protein n=1 Tax=Virgibacillus sp. W0430 TaxID=3391580 RepID=UPI003F45293F
MIKLDTNIVGKQTYFGHIQNMCKHHGYCLAGNWEYDRGYFDTILWREGGETIYVRIPFNVVKGELDRYDAQLEFSTPYIIKHVVNIGLDRDENSLLSAIGFNQFQKPLDTDGHIDNKDKWVEAGEQAVDHFMKYIS